MSSLVDFQGSIGSLLDTMANAMLESEFKSSHPDLTVWTKDNDNDNDSNAHSDGKLRNCERRFGNRESIDETLPPQNEDCNFQSKKSDMRSVVIQLPPKRRKLDPSITTKRLVHGEF